MITNARLTPNEARLSATGVSHITATRAVTIATVVAGLTWAFLADIRESLFLDKRQDLGHFTQAVWATAHGHVLQVTEAGGTDVSRLGIHVDPIIVAFVPFWWFWSSPQLLLTAQAFAFAAAALPIFWLGRKHLAERDAALVAAAYLLCPTVGWNAVSDFHAVSLAVPLLLYAIWFLDEARFVPFAAAAGAAMLCQEQIGLLIGCLGLWYVVQTRRVRPGLVIAVTGFAVSLFDFFVVLRHYSGGSPFAARFGGSPAGLVGDLFTDPLGVVRQLNTHDLSGLALALPVLGACFGSTMLLVAGPQLAILLLSQRANDWYWLGINVLVVIPFVYAATVYALVRSERKAVGRPKLNARLIFGASAMLALIFGPIGMLGVTTGLFPRHTSVEAQRQAVSLVPAGAQVSATNHLALPLATRRYLYVFPVIKDAKWILVDSRDDALPDLSYLQRRVGIKVDVNELYSRPQLMLRELRTLKKSPAWELMYQRDTIYVFKRRMANSVALTSSSGHSHTKLRSNG